MPLSSLLLFLIAVMATVGAARPHDRGSTAPPRYDKRITRSQRRYDEVRITLVEECGSHTPREELFTTNEAGEAVARVRSHRFVRRWTQFCRHTSTVRVRRFDRDYRFAMRNETFLVNIPAPGSPVVGLVIGDPAVSSLFVPCMYCEAYDTKNTLQFAVNAFARSPRRLAKFFHLLGDNFYDETGELTWDFFRGVDDENLKSRVFFSTVVGNHDLWTAGNPLLASPQDQHGYGFLQYYSIDALATKTHPDSVLAGGAGDEEEEQQETAMNPFHLPHHDHFFWYHALGGLGLIGFSGAHEMDVSRFDEACRYFLESREGKAAAFVILLGHWAFGDGGARAGMTTASVYDSMRSSTSNSGVFKGRGGRACRTLARSNRLVFFQGHIHSNHPIHNTKDAESAHNEEDESARGCLLGGSGMVGSGEFGFSVVELHPREGDGKSYAGVRLEVSYFSLAEKPYDVHTFSARLAALKRCVETEPGNDLLGCRRKLSFVKTFMNITLGEYTDEEEEETDEFATDFATSLKL